MKRFFRTAFLLTLLLASCQPKPVVTVPTGTPSPGPLSPAHAPEIRFALIGKPPASDSRVNVWGLFDESGASYINYALRAEYWPRLYHLAPQDSSFQPYAADSQPSEVMQDGDKYSTTVKLRSNLKWTDGSPFTAEDVAFTASTALAFELGYDWGAFYPRDYLDHAEVVDSSTVKFVFKKKPNVGVWQYGVLQAPIAQKAFWESTVNKAAQLLPKDTLRASIDDARTNLATVNAEFADVSAKSIDLKVRGLQSRQLSMDFIRLQDEVIHAQNELNKSLESYAAQIKSAQKVLYAGSDEKEPTLGAWMPDVKKDDDWVNRANPDFPFGKPNFDRSTYAFFADENAALAAFQKSQVDFILSPNGMTSDVPNAKHNPTYNARFLVFNPLRSQLADPAFRSALSCMIDQKMLAVEVLQNKAAPLDAFVLSSQWHDAKIKDACAEMGKSARVEYAVKLLKDARYSWTQEPTTESMGQNLLMSNGEAFPKIILLAPSKEEDALRYAAAKYIAERAQYLGISFAVQEVSRNDVVYAVYSSQKYDMALMGWRLSEYPAYLCEWYGGGNMYLYNSDRFKSTCEALEAETNLNVARPAVAQIEAALMSELPFIPLFTEIHAEIYHGVSYPVPTSNILNGWSGLYGAPSYAIPAP